MTKDDIKYLVFPAVTGFFLGIAAAFLINDTAFGIGTGQSAIIGLVASLTSFFLQFCYRPGNIFGGYMAWLEKNLVDNTKHPLRSFFPILGGCAYCQNVYVTAFYFWMAYIMIGLSWWLLLPAIVLSHLFLTILDIIFWR